MARILAPPRYPADDRWPYRNYPEHLPELPVALQPITYEEQKTIVFASVLPGAISATDQALTNGYDHPFPQVRGWFNLMQGEPEHPCFNPLCRYEQVPVFALVTEEPVPGLHLWSPEGGECVQILFQVCARCGSVTATHETD